ncbi:MAG: 50S ribosomal protein L3 [Nanoarchaeota archaeon]|nr:50S ribosomal protein L3 [Nanoarchaeota archaeon]
MPNKRFARSGSMQFWPRKRAIREYPAVGAWAKKKEAVPLGFAGYKVGMCHVIYADNKKTSKTKGQDISCPVTIIECPPIKIIAIRFYTKDHYGFKPAKDFILASDKELSRKICLPKKNDAKELDKINPEDYVDMKIIVCTQPKLTGIGKKKPEVFEVGLGGNIKEKFEYAKQNLGKEIKITDIFKEGEAVDLHAVTKGKGFQGPVKRFGVGIRSHKAEKTKRGPGSLGGWKAQGHVMYRVAHAGQMGYHTRTEYNKWLMKIASDSKDIEGITPKSGFRRYGVVKNPYVMIKGSVFGPAKRMIRMNAPLRTRKGTPKESPSIQKIIIKG